MCRALQEEDAADNTKTSEKKQYHDIHKEQDQEPEEITGKPEHNKTK